MVKCTLKNTTIEINQHCLREKCPYESGCGYKYLFNDKCEYVKEIES